MSTSMRLHKSRSNETLNRTTCYDTTDAKSSCDLSNMYERTPAFCTQFTEQTNCESAMNSNFCSWSGTTCVLKDTGKMDLVSP